MQITETKIKVFELCQGYTDDGDGGVYPLDEHKFCWHCGAQMGGD